jgi:hypothetical protein
MNIEVYPFCNGQGRSTHLGEEVEMELMEIITQKESGNDASMFSQHKYKCQVCSQQISLRVFA